MTNVILAIVSLAMLVVLGSAVLGVVWAIVEAVLGLVRDARYRLSSSAHWQRLTGASTGPAVVEATQIPASSADLSTDALWHRMQGTSSRTRRGGRRS